MNTVTGSPLDIADDADLAEYIKDSIDLGELLAVISSETGVTKDIQSFQGVRTYSEFYAVLCT